MSSRRLLSFVAAVVAVVMCVAVISVALLGCTPTADNTPPAHTTCLVQGHEVDFIAHRGLSSAAQANTLQAFTLAAQADGFWGIETDVWATSDNVLVCMHDAYAVQGILDVSKATADEVLNGTLAADGVSKPCSFADYLDCCRSGNKVAVVEIKDPDMEDETLDLILSALDEKQVDSVIISFYLQKLQYIRSKRPAQRLQLLLNKDWKIKYKQPMQLLADKKAVENMVIEDMLQLALDGRMDISCRSDFLQAEWSDLFHNAGCKVGVWTVNDAELAMRMIVQCNADYVTTDKTLYDELIGDKESDTAV